MPKITQEFCLPPEKQWENLTLANDFLFGRIMHDENLCTKLIRLILPDMDIGHIKFTQTQKSSRQTLDTRGVRFDVFAGSDNRKIFVCEMQTSDRKDLPKRTRAYHIASGLETMNIETLAKSGSYNNMLDVFVIFICTFDAFGKGRHIYTFYNTCNEDPTVRLNDGATTVFLNAKGTADDVSPGLKAFLDFVMGRTSENLFVRELSERLNLAKQNARWRESYMFEQMHEWEKYGEGRLEGRTEATREIFNKLLEAGMKIEEAAKITGFNLEGSINV